MDEIEKKEEWYLNIDYREAKEIIRNKLQGMTQNFIGIGFYLRQIKETEGFQKDGYASIYEMAEDQYGIKRSTAIRWMQMNEKFSQGGYSPFLDSGYKDFGKSQLQEMLYLDSEQLEEVTPEMTVREIREIRTPDLEPEEQLPGQMSVEDYQEISEENEPVIVEQPEGIAIVDAPSEPELYEEVSEKTDIDIAREENLKARMYLEMAEKEFSQNDIRVRKQKILVAALAGYIHDLDMVLNPPEEPEQPELPMFRNNDQRKEWLRNHRDWGVWYTDEHIGCTYYKYDFENGARLIAEEYESKYTDYVSYLHLINGPKSPRGKNGQTKWTIHDCYTKYPNSESELVEFLKWIQKGEK